jgi:hypothetical protein
MKLRAGRERARWRNGGNKFIGPKTYFWHLMNLHVTMTLMSNFKERMPIAANTKPLMFFYPGITTDIGKEKTQ